jgi:hypothetical protein
MSKRTLFLIFALFIITGVLLMVALYNPNAKPAAIPITPTPKEEIAQTVLSFGSTNIATSSSVASLKYSVPINISTGKNKVTAVQLEMQYDPQVITKVTVVPGPFFTKPEVLLEQIDEKTGRITYAFGSGLTEPSVVGQGIVANLTFEAKATPLQTTIISFLPKTLVTAEGINQSVLKQTNDIQIIIGEK